MLPCGDIRPTVGVTGTPVVDPSRGASSSWWPTSCGRAHRPRTDGHGTATGSVESTVAVDPPGADPDALLQRTGLALDDGPGGVRHGRERRRLRHLPRAGGVRGRGRRPADLLHRRRGPGRRPGGDLDGRCRPHRRQPRRHLGRRRERSVYSADRPYDDSDSALELSPGMALLQYFAPTTWPRNKPGDLDMSMAPALLPDGQVVLAGKSRIVYLLDSGRLGGIGGQVASLDLGCGGEIDGGGAVAGDRSFSPAPRDGRRAGHPVPCLAPRAVWAAHASAEDPRSRPHGLVWTIGQDGTLTGSILRPGRCATGADRCAGEPFPDARRRRRPAAGPGGGPGSRLRHRGAIPVTRRRHPPPRPAAAPTVRSALSAAPASAPVPWSSWWWRRSAPWWCWVGSVRRRRRLRQVG